MVVVVVVVAVVVVTVDDEEVGAMSSGPSRGGGYAMMVWKVQGLGFRSLGTRGRCVLISFSFRKEAISATARCACDDYQHSVARQRQS